MSLNYPLVFFLPPPPPRSTLFPYTTLFRSRRRDGAVGVDHDGVGELVRIDLAPGNRLGRGRARQAARIGAGVGDLDEVVVAAVGQTEDLLDLRLGLQDEILRRPTAQHQDPALAVPLPGGVDDAGGLVDVARHVDARTDAAHRQFSDVHPDRRIEI